MTKAKTKEKISSNDSLLTPIVAAERFRVHPKTLSRWADKGLIAVVFTPGKHRRYKKAEIDRLLADENFS